MKHQTGSLFLFRDNSGAPVLSPTFLVEVHDHEAKEEGPEESFHTGGGHDDQFLQPAV